METPALKSSENQYATDEPFAVEAAEKIKSLCNNSFIVFFDKKLSYRRNAAESLYVYLHKDSHLESINQQLIREGYARYWTLGLDLEPGKAEEFLYAQEQAQFDGVGMWAK